MNRADLDEVEEVYIPAPNLQKSVLTREEGSNEVLMIQHREHEGFEQNFVTPLSPILHFPVMPCYLRLSFPRGLVCEAKLPLASTRSLSKRQSQWGIDTGQRD